MRKKESVDTSIEGYSSKRGDTRQQDTERYSLKRRDAECHGLMQKGLRSWILVYFLAAMTVCGCCFGLNGCGKAAERETSQLSDTTKDSGKRNGDEAPADGISPGGYISNESTSDIVNFDRRLDGYQPMKKEYNFYFTYKVIHPWWDAVAIGIEDAAKQYEEEGIIINYEYLAPEEVSAHDQIQRLTDAAARDFDVIGVDVADVDIVAPVINGLLETGQKIMTFSSSDAPKEDGCSRIAYVGNTHNYEDGADLTEALCKKLKYQGKIAVLIGTRGAPCHEERAQGAKDVIAKYPDMEIVETAYDEDSVEKSYQLAREFLLRHEDLDGFVCCNMSNPVGAARAVVEAGREDEVTIVGMDHDQEALRYLRDGIIYVLGVQDCYSIGFDTVQVAVKIADGCMPGETYPEKTEEITTIIYQESAAAMLQTLYGVID